ncbi:MAG TPA: hypothetical protein VNO75_09360 [Gemmatimonadaceae bacterium]|nr:hypothetical protein [Gemmatimonadaceae bacterium]
MSDERRYHEDEVRQIFESASTAADARYDPASARNSLTLRELQDIGHQVGIEPERIAEAALAIDASRPPDPLPAVPISVRRTAPLSRAPTDAEWRMLVSDLRETFDAPGQLGQSAGIFEWRNGNLHAYIEPTPSGYRLRMGTRNTNLVAMAVAGAAGLVWSAAVFVGLSMTGDLAAGFLAPAIVSVLGAGALGTSLFRLRKWARTRADQMHHVAERARNLLGE